MEQGRAQIDKGEKEIRERTGKKAQISLAVAGLRETGSLESSHVVVHGEVRQK